MKILFDANVTKSVFIFKIWQSHKNLLKPTQTPLTHLLFLGQSLDVLHLVGTIIANQIYQKYFEIHCQENQNFQKSMVYILLFITNNCVNFIQHISLELVECSRKFFWSLVAFSIVRKLLFPSFIFGSSNGNWKLTRRRAWTASMIETFQK